MSVKVKYSDKLRKKYNLPDYFQNKTEELKFWQNMNPNKKVEILLDRMAEYCIKKYGKVHRLERVARIKYLKQKNLK